MTHPRINTIARNGHQGFTLIELGIVLAVVGILSMVVMYSSGFIEQAKVVKAMHHIVALRDAALNYSADIRNGVDFENLNINSLVENNYFPTSTQNAWNLEPAFELIPISGNETTEAFFQINYQLPNGIIWTQVATALEDVYLSVAATNNTSPCTTDSSNPCWGSFQYTP
jgi:prepilin-type N-terminal cleavage/methylation domain-containing protein